VGRRFVCGFGKQMRLWQSTVAQTKTRGFSKLPRGTKKKHQSKRTKKPATVSRDGLSQSCNPGAAKRPASAWFYAAYLAFSAEFVMASPPFEISCPAPAIVLQPASAAVPAMRSKAISRFMKVLLVENALVDVPMLYGTRQLS
jgi:hypothetical protein